MANRSFSEQSQPWLGPFAYVISAILASIANLVTLTRFEQHVTQQIFDDAKGVLGVFTAISLLSFILQFIYARAMSASNGGTLTLGVAPALFSGLFVSVATFFAIDSTRTFQATIAMWVGVATLTALLPVGILATCLSKERWLPICLFTLVASVARLILWELPFAQAGLPGLLAALTAAHVIAYLALVLLARPLSFSSEKSIKLRNQLVPLGTLSSFAVLISAGSIGRKSSLGDGVSTFTDAALLGRNLLFVSAIFAYASFPFLTSSELFSRELGQRFRQAELIVVGITFVLGLLIVKSAIVPRELLGNGSNTDSFLLAVTVLAWALIAISLIPVLYYVAHNSRLGLVTLVPATGMIAAHFICTTPRSLAGTFLVCAFILALIVLIPAVLRNKPVIRAQLAGEHNVSDIQREPITIVIPSHNSGTLGLATIKSVHDLFSSIGVDVRVIAVSDGSTDESVDLFNSIDLDWFTHIHLVENRGKGGALRVGFEQSTSDITGFIDADGDIPAHVLLPMYQELIHRDADVVFGSKWHPASKIKVTTSRKLLSGLHHLIQRVLFKIDIDDTQVGVKLYKTSSLREVLPTLQETGFSLDIELFIALAAYGHDNFVEMPVEIQRTGSSTISLKNVVISFLDLLRIFWRARVSLNYAALAYTSKNKLEVNQL